MTQELTVVPASAIVPMIDIEAQKLRMDNIREFVKSVLSEEHGHYGRMPGVDRPFLKQPGAEALYRAFEARPQYEFVEAREDWDNDFCYFLVKCRVIHVVSGYEMGEDFGACSSLEFAANCRAQEREQTGPDDVYFDCPIHGPNAARSWWNREARKRMLACPKKVPQGLDRTLQNVVSKAKKRAMVSAIRQVGCVSELFTQDEDLVDRRETEEQRAPVSMPRARSAAPAKAPAAAPRANGVPLVEQVKTAMAAVKEAGVTNDEITVFFTDAGLMKDGDKLSGRLVTDWCEASKSSPNEWAKAVIGRFRNVTEDPSPEVIDGDFTEVAFPE